MEGKNCSIENVEINEARILKAISGLKDNKAAGVDEINWLLIIGSKYAVIEPLQLIFKQCFDQGEIPHEWKRANISAIFKKGLKKEANNYRSVSLTCHAYKNFRKNY